MLQWWPWLNNVRILLMLKLLLVLPLQDTHYILEFIRRYCFGAAFSPWMAAAQFIGVTLLALNRYTGIVYPVKHHMVYSYASIIIDNI
jgi:hypothetical protein